MEFLYCLNHGHTSPVQHCNGLILHEYPIFSEYTISGFDIDWCFFEMGWATSEMPEVREDWDLDEEPSPEEMELIEKEAEYIWE
jgi:hypothetical protein